MTEIRYIIARCPEHREHFFIQRMDEDGQPVGVSKQVFLEALGAACDDIEQQNHLEESYEDRPQDH